MRNRRTINTTINTTMIGGAGFLAGLLAAGGAALLLARPRRPRAAALPDDRAARAVGGAPPSPHAAPLLPELPHPVPPRLKMGMVGMTRFVAAIVLFAVISTAAGLVGVTYATNRQNRQEAVALTGGDPDQGQLAIQSYGCASCHTIPGIHGANGQVGPPLTQIGGRMYVGGVLANTPQNLVRWVMDPPGVDPATAMPDLHVSESDARDIACYLYTLR